MDIAVHAQLMAQTCSRSFAQLVLEVPTRYGSDHELARKLIATISHADKMSRIGQPPAPEMILRVADKLLQAARGESFSMQDAAAHQLIRLVSHANSMARIVPEVADDIFALVGPLADDPLPTRKPELDRLSQREDAVQSGIRDVCHQAQMRRIVAGS